MKKRVLGIIIACMIPMMLFANGSQESQKANETTGTKPVTLRISWWGSDSRHKPTLAVLDMYHQANPSVTINGEYGGWDGYYQKIVTQIAGDTAADLIQIDQPWLYELQSKGDVFAEITDKDIDLSQFDAEFLKNYCSYDGKIMGLPTGTNVLSMLMDRKMLQDFGIDPDTVWTWDNMISEGKKIHAADPNKYFLMAAPDACDNWFKIYLSQLCGSFINKDKSLGFTEAQATEAYAYLKSWVDQGIIEPYSISSLYNNKGEEDPNWVNGNIAMQTSWVSAFDKLIGNRQNMDSCKLPVREGAKNSRVLTRPSQIFVVNNRSANKAEAQKLLRFMYEDKTAVETLGTSRGIPSTTFGRQVLADKNMISTLSQKATDEGLSQAGWAETTWEMNSNVVQTMQDILAEVMYGKITPNQGAKKLIHDLTDVLASL
jgi:oligogalacturonide transport system substrate-binding protein